MKDNVRHNWTLDEINELYHLPFADLMYHAQQVHRQYFDPNAIQKSMLHSIKTGKCPEDCAYCPQSGHYNTNIQTEKLISKEAVIKAAQSAKERGATRFCMGAAWRGPHQKDLPAVLEMVRAVKDLGLETCVTLGMLKDGQAEQLKEAGLDYYNHNLDSSPEFYKKIISTRTYEDRLDTLEKVRNAKINVCCGGIIGMGESREDRCGLLQQLANLSKHPGSVPINLLNPVEGTPLENEGKLDPIELVRTIAIARIMMPQSVVRLSAGRHRMSDELQALCFLAGANSIFLGEKLFCTPLPGTDKDENLLQRLGIRAWLPESETESTC